MTRDNDLFVDDVMREVWQWKADIAAKYPTQEAREAHRKEYRKQLEAEGWKFADPADVPAGRQAADDTLVAREV
jgi:hypothetical protein